MRHKVHSELHSHLLSVLKTLLEYAIESVDMAGSLFCTSRYTTWIETIHKISGNSGEPIYLNAQDLLMFLRMGYA